jgi:hypothetical protein
MAENFITPAHRQFLARLRLFFGLGGALFLGLGLVRLLSEFSGNLGQVVLNNLSPDLFQPSSLPPALAFLLAGYGAGLNFWALQAYVPSAWRLTRWVVLGMAGAIWAAFLWGLVTAWPYALFFLVLGVALTAFAGWVWRQGEALQVWQVFGQPIQRGFGARRAWLWLGVALSLGGLVALLGLAEALITGRLDPAPDQPPSGSLLYTTTFDAFNDEWDLPRGREAATVVAGELVLEQTLSNAAFYARLDSRRFRDFDLRVQTRQVSGTDDNRYGVVFAWRDFETYFIFEISGDGYYRLSKYTKGKVAEALTPWTPSDLIKQGTQVNFLRVVVRAETAEFFINGQTALLCTKGENREPALNVLTGECITHPWQSTYRDSALGHGKIGLLVGTTLASDVSVPVVVAFDNLLIQAP